MNNAIILCDTAFKRGKDVCITAVGVSMWPIIKNGTRAVITSISGELPPKGSLLLIKRSNRLIVHRFWGIIYKDGTPMVLTKGDTNLNFDSPVPVSMVLGQVSILKSPLGRSMEINRGWHYLLGRIICCSNISACIWARFCRLMLKLRRKVKEK